jgi:DNA-binding winged helix-turn-helix (wHTH) protein
MTHADRAFSRSQLLDQVWGDRVYVEERTVDVHVRRLRKALEQTGHEHLLQTVRGVGYRFSGKMMRANGSPGMHRRAPPAGGTDVRTGAIGFELGLLLPATRRGDIGSPVACQRCSRCSPCC